MLVKQLGEVIKARRKELRITQPHLAELAEISINTLNKLEGGKGNPSCKVVNKIADVLGLECVIKVKNNITEVL
jgi:transcriptional regulator with XRE-family HTH domain